MPRVEAGAYAPDDPVPHAATYMGKGVIMCMKGIYADILYLRLCKGDIKCETLQIKDFASLIERDDEVVKEL